MQRFLWINQVLLLQASVKQSLQYDLVVFLFTAVEELSCSTLVNSSEFEFHFALLSIYNSRVPRSSRGIEKGNVLFTRCYVVAKCREHN